jgi:hypothetical protein
VTKENELNASTAAVPATAPSKGLHYGLWAVQALLALAFLGAGVMKLTAPIEELAKNMTWIQSTGGGLVRFIGLSEALGALGLILPAATRIQPKLTVAAAGALTLVMVLAAGTHVMLNDAAHMAPALVLGALSAFVAYGRAVKAPILPRA